jgi:2-polyprenyl-6-methoxyphenol hydroxylase-like FAD-dependent oxidoreductase
MLGIMPAGQGATYIFYCVGNRSFEDLKRDGLGRFKEEVTQAAPELTEAFGTMEAWTRIAYFTPSFIRVDPWIGNGVALLGDQHIRSIPTQDKESTCHCRMPLR